ncbi:MAG: nuclease [Alphaproteobacteria bacterium]|nr:MAG: nuclease [Alphaproteobacteria bacterium]
MDLPRSRRERAGAGRRSATRRLADVAIGFTLLAALALAAAWLSRVDEGEVSGRAQVADGDSLRFGGRRVRLVGIDAPELTQLCRDGAATVECGRAARDHLARLIGSAAVTCTGARQDRYDRLLARCRARGVELNAAMVRDGWALADGGYFTEEVSARSAGRGLWALSFETPRQWRRLHGEAAGPGLLQWLGQALTGLVGWLTDIVRN